MGDVLDDLDELMEQGRKKVVVSEIEGRGIHNGFYTVTFPCGTGKTFRLRTCLNGKLKGKRLLGLLIGPDNTSDYEDFAFVGDKGVQVWKRWRGKRQEEYGRMLWKMWGGEILDGHELMESRRCLKCNRTLTDEESLKLGIGPSCRKGLNDG